MDKAKKLFLSVFALFCLSGGSAWAQTIFKSGGLTYKVTDATAKTVEVTYYNGTNNSGNAAGYTGDITFPQTVTNGGVTYAVTTIGAYAFEYASITSVTIPASVTRIEGQAFNGCKSLTNVRFEPASEKLSMVAGYYGSFVNSGNDMEVFVDREMTLSGNDTPFGSAKVSSVVIGPNVAAITPYLFYDVTNVASVSYSPNAKAAEIGAYAFYGCKSLSAVSLPVICPIKLFLERPART